MEVVVEEAEEEGSLPLEERVQRLDQLPVLLLAPALAAAKPRRDRLSLGLRPVDRLVRKRAPVLPARVTSAPPDSGQLAVPLRPIGLPRADQRRVS